MATQQLNEEVKNEVINHTARKIEIVYEPGKTVMTQQDKKMMNSYVRQHDFEVEMSQTARQLVKEFSPVNDRIDELRTELKKVKEVFGECSNLADELSDTTYDPQVANLDMLAKSQQETSAKLLPYSNELQEVYENIKPLHIKLNAYNIKNEEESERLVDEFSALQTEHSVNWEQNSIDIVAFDNESDNFRNYRSMQVDHRASLIDVCSSTLNNYAMLNVESEVVYEVWKEFLKRCDLIRAIALLREQATRFTAN